MIVVIGGRGFIGKILVKVLGCKDASRKGEIKVDITKPKTLKKLRKFSTIIHCASKIGYTWLPWFQNYKSFYKINVEGTENLLKVVYPKYFIYISTLAIYKTQRLKNIRPRSFYGLTKYLAELKCKEYAKKKKFKLLIIRLPMVYDIKEPKRETWLFLKFAPFLELFRPILRKKKIRVISRKRAVKIISLLVKRKEEGVINIPGKLIDIYSFILMLRKKHAFRYIKKHARK